MTAAKPKSTSIESICAICGDAADGIHYKVISCRGCNAFFRRAITFNANYTCRKGGRCPLSKDARCTCRACRLEKCFEVGMDAEAVQPKRDTNRNYKWVARKRKCSTERESPASVSSPSLSPTTSSEFKCLPTFRPLSSVEEGTLIESLILQELVDERRTRTLMCRSIDEFVKCNEDDFELKPLTADGFTFVQRMMTIRIMDWCDSIPEFRTMSSADKTKLLKAFSMKFTLLECVFGMIARKLTDRLVIGTTYIEIGKVGIENKNDSAATVQLKAKLFSESVGLIINELGLPMSNMNITLGERAALRLIVFWNPGNIGLDTNTAAQLKTYSNRVINELHIWYEKNNVENIPERFGNFMLLLPALAKNALGCAEDIVIMNTFDLAGEGCPMFEELMKP